MAKWRFWIDRGGTFTDVVARRDDGLETTAKLLSVNPAQYMDAAVEGVRRILEAHGGSAADIASVKLGTTVATNALLERKGERVVLLATEGFADALEIGQQARPDIFALHIRKPDLLHTRVIEVRERVSAEGAILTPLDESHARAELRRAYADGFRSAAIACLHAWAWPAHEDRLAQIARETGFDQVSTSSGVSRLIRYIPRTDTAVADAYLSPVLDRYAGALSAAFPPGTELRFMQSNGGLASAGAFRGKDAVLSGPAGGVVGMALAARQAGFDKALGFDMGGTSTDVSHFAGSFERTNDTVVAGVRISTPMLQVHTVAAGGGSICFFDGARLRVGPHSAGADPGPACYRKGGPLTITDCNVLLGRIRPEFFPAIFGLDANLPLDRDIVSARFIKLCAEIERATGRRLHPEEAAAGFLDIANQHMAEAVRKISIQRGYDPAEYALVAFGGAGGQHACAVAEAVGAGAVLLHPLAGLLSAWGIGQTGLRTVVEATVEVPLDQFDDLETRSEALAAHARASLDSQGATGVNTLVFAHMKLQGADSTLAIPVGDRAAMRAAFVAAHIARFGFGDGNAAIVVASLSAESVEPEPAPPPAVAGPPSPAAPIATVDLWAQGAYHAAPVFHRASLSAGFVQEGPALILDEGATTFVEHGWRAAMNSAGDIILTRTRSQTTRDLVADAVDPILLEVFSNRFMAVAEEMGLALQATASSVNIKERLDFSCAVFDATGGLVANAPHIPVHLGSMGDSVRAIVNARGRTMKAGDLYMLNAPHAGGTHLPDITVVAPVFLDGETDPAFFTAARGHHADVGGLTPGSMPPDSRTVAEEGVLLENILLVEGGRLREAAVRALFATGPHPARNIDRNIEDLKAQAAACLRGGDELRRMVAHYGHAGVKAYMQHVQDNAAEQIRRVIDRLRPGEFAITMDNGATVRVAVTPDPAARTVRVDFTGTSPQLTSNFNAPPSIARSATLYVFRTLVDDGLPLNEGCMRPIELIVPEGCFLNPRPGAAVVAGNVETSQVVVDALYGAMGVLAGSQGTMNNFTFGDGQHQYYETVCGGSGAGPGFDGADAVQTHMTNSRLTDPEVLESRFPVLVEAFSVRRGSGGAGRHHGGDGAVRRIRFRAPMTAAILSNHRAAGPRGLQGGRDGMAGVNRIERADGRAEILPATVRADMAPGDVFVIETPGGGGFGKPEGR